MPTAKALENLKAWKPGQSGNPTGKRKHSIVRFIEEALGENVLVRGADGKTKKQTKAKWIGHTMVRLAIRLLRRVEADEEIDNNLVPVYRECLAYVLRNADPDALNGKDGGVAPQTELIVKTEAGALFAGRAVALHALNGKLGPAQLVEAFRQAKLDEMELAKQENTQ